MISSALKASKREVPWFDPKATLCLLGWGSLSGPSLGRAWGMLSLLGCMSCCRLGCICWGCMPFIMPGCMPPCLYNERHDFRDGTQTCCSMYTCVKTVAGKPTTLQGRKSVCLPDLQQYGHLKSALVQQAVRSVSRRSSNSRCDLL